MHSLIARILFVATRARPDLLTLIAYMTKKVTNPTQEDGRKLLRALRYMADTSDMVLTLGYRGVPSLHVYIDASFATHTDMKSHTGVLCTLGTGAFYSKSTSQKINTTSSCEAELVALAKGLQQAIWSRTFLAAQGFDTPPDHCAPGQPIYDQTNRAWTPRGGAVPAYQHRVLLAQRPHQARHHRHQVLPHSQHARRLLYKAPPGLALHRPPSSSPRIHGY